MDTVGALSTSVVDGGGKVLELIYVQWQLENGRRVVEKGSRGFHNGIAKCGVIKESSNPKVHGCKNRFCFVGGKNFWV